MSDAAGTADVLIIGAGIAGAGAAYETADFASVILIERESVCGYHSTARSAASFTENYGAEVIRRLAKASRAFLQQPPAAFCAFPLLSPRGRLGIARADQLELLHSILGGARLLTPDILELSVREARERVPVLRQDYLAGAFYEPGCMDLDVEALHQGYLRGAKARGVRLVTNAAVRAMSCRNGLWTVVTAAGVFHAPTVVNAAGAWADAVAEMAGVGALGLIPKRRTALIVSPPVQTDVRNWPLVDDVGEELYFKPDAGRLLVSPADATPVQPADAVAEELDVAVAVDRLERATTINVRRVARTWAGLRTFAADGAPVVGFERGARGFFWLAGQGGYGIKTSPALSRACAALIRESRLPQDLIGLGIRAADLSPERLRGPAAVASSFAQDSLT